jgi:protocatechuate 3,4-dioxygenase, beta subunit
MKANISLPRRARLRQALAYSAGLALPGMLMRESAARTQLALTPTQTEGPFYPDEALKDADADLLRNAGVAYTSGQPVWLRGLVMDIDSKPVSGATVEIWQCDHEGTYRHSSIAKGRAAMLFQGFGREQVGSDGRFAFRTIKPVLYTGRPPHVHFKVKLGKRELLTTQMYVKGDKSNSQDFILRSLNPAQRAMLEVEFKPAADGLEAFFPIVVAA